MRDSTQGKYLEYEIKPYDANKKSQSECAYKAPPKKPKLKLLKELIFYFLDTSSIRGCNRITKADNTFVRFLWISYLFITTIILTVSIVRVMKEYHSYQVNMQTIVSMDDPQDFPDITFCNHQQFSEKAIRLWQNNEVLSPTEFNRLNRRIAANISDMALHARFNFVSDGAETYYQNLDMHTVKKIGHTRNATIARCLIEFQDSHMFYSGPGCWDDIIEVREVSDHRFFNCFTIHPNATRTKLIKSINLIIHLGPNEEERKNHTKGFLIDLFSQAVGLRVAIHEPRTKPDLSKSGIHVEPGRLNELNFKSILRKHKNTPTNPCFTEMDFVQYKDLDVSFNYTFETCLEAELQKLVLRNCTCLKSELIRVQSPSNEYPYCGRYLQDNGCSEKQIKLLAAKIKCVSDLFMLFSHVRSELKAKGVCRHKCRNVLYESTTSKTHWNPQEWQLHWFSEILNGLMTRNISELQKYNLMEDLDKFDKKQEDIVMGTSYTYLVVKRESNNTEIRQEQLVFTINALWSRIGGLCSLYIGMTVAVAIEIVEFLYNAIVRYCITENSPRIPNKRCRPEPSWISLEDENDANKLEEVREPDSRIKSFRISMISRSKSGSFPPNENDPMDTWQPMKPNDRFSCKNSNPASPKLGNGDLGQ
ncbi:hypothetical protein Ciccas_006902 [Cichlidogyrus casuarinus]|uniref:Uncharacterized protein n=1 Tax=Cichlidogyrus casuarinus TaxID=1844966 RepID=A0ABD2Q4F7_9PLAT